MTSTVIIWDIPHSYVSFQGMHRTWCALPRTDPVSAGMGTVPVGVGWGDGLGSRDVPAKHHPLVVPGGLRAHIRVFV